MDHSKSTDGNAQRGTDLYAQLEVMMGAVKQESAELAAAREQLTELQERNKDIPKLAAMLQLESEQNAAHARKLHEADIVVSQLRGDMQRLNDIYSKERQLRVGSEQQGRRLQNDLEVANKNLRAVSEDMGHMRESMASLKKQSEEASYAYGLEKNEMLRSLALVRSELEECEKAKKDVSLHFWNIKQDTQQLQDVLTNVMNENAELKSQYSLVRSRNLKDNEALLMLSEDRRSEIVRLADSHGENKRTIRNLQSESKQLYQAIQLQESQVTRMSKQLAEASHGSQSKVDELAAENKRLTMLLEGSRETSKAHAAEIESLKSNSSSVGKLEVQKRNLEAENERLKASLKSKEESLVSVETSLSQLMAVREQEVLSIESNGSFIEQLQVQLKDANEDKWAMERDAKERADSLTEQLGTAQRNVDDLTARVDTMKNEKLRYEEFMKQEIQNAGQLGTLLKNELELRLEELTQTRREKDGLAAQVEMMGEEVVQLKTALGRSDAQFRETLESDRAKVQQDLRLKTNRCRMLEAEKQELLSETSALMQQVRDHQVKRDAAISQAEKASQLLTKSETEIDTLNIQISDLTKELKISQRRETDLKNEFVSKEQEFRQDLSKLDSIIKASAKSATTQVAEMSERMRILSAINEEQKLRIASLEAIEKKTVGDSSRRADELRILSERHEATVQQMAAELTVVRRDLGETRARVKLSQDDGLKKEREIMSLQTETNKIEAEVHRYRERLRDAEDRSISAGEQLSVARREIDSLSTELRRVRASLADQDQAMVVKTRAVERAERDLKALEQEGFTETKKLRAKLKEAMSELDALRNSELPRLRKELENASSSHGKLQSTNSATINGLIAEVNATEDALTKERRAREQEVSNFQSRIKELEITLENAQEIIKEHTSRVSSNHTEKSSRMSFLETEVDRLKSVLCQRDERISELEKQQQGGRLTMQNFRDSQANLEASLAEARRALDQEVSSRRSLEHTVRRLQKKSPRVLSADQDAGVDEDAGHSDDDMELSNGLKQYREEPSNGVTGLRAMSPIDIYTGASRGSSYEDEDVEAQTRCTAVSSLSSSASSSRFSSPFVAKGEAVDSSSGTATRMNAGRDFPTHSGLRMSPVDESMHSYSRSPNNKYPEESHFALNSNPPSVSKSMESYPARFQKAVKFSSEATYDAESDEASPGVRGRDYMDGASVGSMEEEAQESINRTQMYLQQRMANKNAAASVPKPSGGNRFSAPNATLPVYAAHSSPLVTAAASSAHVQTSQNMAAAEEEEEEEEGIGAGFSDADYDGQEEPKQHVVSRRKKPQGLKKSKKKRAPKIEFIGGPGNFHIQSSATSMQTSSSVDNIHFPNISSGGGGKK